MNYQLCIFEDKKVENFFSLTLTRPVYDLRCGISTLGEKILRAIGEDIGAAKEDIHFLCRSYLAPVISQKYRAIKVNKLKDLKKKDVLFINGRLLPSEENRISPQSKEEIVIQGEDIVYAYLSKATLKKLTFTLAEEIEQSLAQVTKMVQVKKVRFDPAGKKASFNLMEYPWDLVRFNGEAIKDDFELKGKSGIKGIIKEGAYLNNPGQIYVGKGTLIESGVFLNAEKGPIYIEENVRVRPPTVIDGPSYIGQGTIIDGAKIREGCSIGPVCRISGEVEESIFYAYSNKHHEGFVGHSYVGEWVNIAALTTTSDLKNTYGEIKVHLKGKKINTGQLKVGSFIGDHTKIGIGTLLEVGCIIGVACNIFGGGNIPKYIPSFSWGGKDTFTENKLDKVIKVAELIMARRKVKQTQTERDLLMKVCELTAEEHGE